MTIRLDIFYPELKNLFGAAGQVSAEGTTVGELLADLVARAPAAEKLLFASPGRLHRRVYVFVNHEGMQKASMEQAVKEGDRLIIAVLASGG